MQSFKSFLSLLTEMPLPVAVGIPKTTLELADYKKQLIQSGVTVGKGSSRVVIKVNLDGKESVLKIAINNNGLKQNSNEKNIIEKYSNIFSNAYNPLLPIIDDYNNYHSVSGLPVWLQFEVVTPFKKTHYKELNDYFVPIYGDFSKVPSALPFLNMERPDSKGKKEFGFEVCFLNSFRSKLKSKPSTFSDNQWNNLKALYRFIDQTKTSIHDLRIPENWGLTLDSKQLKIIDLGFSDEFCKSTKQLRVKNSNGVLNFY